MADLQHLRDRWPLEAPADYTMYDYLTFGGPIVDCSPLRSLVDELKVRNGTPIGEVAIRMLALVNELLNANYLFASDLASVRTALLARASEFDPTEADGALSTAREIVLNALLEENTGRAKRPDHLRRRGLSDLPDTAALPFLRRRLLHIERSARNVSALAARAVQSG